MRTRWLVLLLGVSLAANVTLGVALLVSWRGASSATVALANACAAPLCAEEGKVREELAAALCARPPDRAAIGAMLARLDAVRARQRDQIVDRWLARCAGAGSRERAALTTTVRGFLCPWCASGRAASAAPTPVAPPASDQPRHHGPQQGRNR